MKCIKTLNDFHKLKVRTNYKDKDGPTFFENSY